MHSYILYRTAWLSPVTDSARLRTVEFCKKFAVGYFVTYWHIQTCENWYIWIIPVILHFYLFKRSLYQSLSTWISSPWRPPFYPAWPSPCPPAQHCAQPTAPPGEPPTKHEEINGILLVPPAPHCAQPAAPPGEPPTKHEEMNGILLVPPAPYCAQPAASPGEPPTNTRKWTETETGFLLGPSSSRRPAYQHEEMNGNGSWKLFLFSLLQQSLLGISDSRNELSQPKYLKRFVSNKPR